MIRLKRVWLSMIACMCMVACTTVKEGNSLDQCNVVASRLVTDGDTLVVCDVSKIEQHIKLPLSTLVKNWKLLKLENTSKEALVLPAYIYPSENYILIHPGEFNRGAMLFDKTGKYSWRLWLLIDERRFCRVQ